MSIGCQDICGKVGACRNDINDCSCCSPVGCSDLGCGCGACCPVRPTRKKTTTPCPPLPCCGSCCDPRAHHLNRSPYCCPCRPEPDGSVYRCCEGMIPSYAGHVPGFTFHSLARPFTKATFGTKSYMQKCMFYNSWSKI